MPLYDYKFVDTGEIQEVYQLMRDDPLVEIDGRAVVRLISRPNLCGVEHKVHGWPRLSNSLPTSIKGCKMVRDRSGRYKPLITSERHEREVMAKNDLVRESNTFDGEEF